MNSRGPVIGSFATLIETEPKKSPSPQSAIDLLALVSQMGTAGEVSVSDLLQKSELRLDQLGEFLSTLRAGQLISMSGEWGRETVSLTDLGKTVAQAAKPVA